MKIEVTNRKMAKTRTNSAALWPVEKLVPYAKNPRTHSDAQIAQIAESIEEFGFTNPIFVDTKAGILAGHGRLRAAQKLGLAKVPVLA
jgi:ParB-like chromosome segregation protein Spo0J